MNNKKYPTTGGIVGQCESNSNILYTYSTGEVSCGELLAGLIVGKTGKSTITNCFGLAYNNLNIIASKYTTTSSGCSVFTLSDDDVNNIKKWNQEQINSNLKAPNVTEPIFLKDTNKNGGYPILDWQ